MAQWLPSISSVCFLTKRFSEILQFPWSDLASLPGPERGIYQWKYFCKNLQSHIFIEWFYYYVFALSLEKVNVFY